MDLNISLTLESIQYYNETKRNFAVFSHKISIWCTLLVVSL